MSKKLYGWSEFRYVRHAVSSFLFMILSLPFELLRYFEKYHIEKLPFLYIFPRFGTHYWVPVNHFGCTRFYYVISENNYQYPKSFLDVTHFIFDILDILSLIFGYPLITLIL